ncbi:MAG: hypothetical protein AB7P42_20635 [Gammaproteobacteria bacterium]
MTKYFFQAKVEAARPGTGSEMRCATHPEGGIKRRVQRGASLIDPPSRTLPFRFDGDKVHLQPAAHVRDSGAQVEVVAGLAGGEQVRINAPDSMAEGQAVTVVTASSH